MAQNEMKAKPALPERVRSMEGLDRCRRMEGLRLRVKDVDFDRHAIVVREAKGNKARVVMSLHSLEGALRRQMLTARSLWVAARQAQRGGVDTPHALEAKYPREGSTWGWLLGPYLRL